MYWQARTKTAEEVGVVLRRLLKLLDPEILGDAQLAGVSE